MNLNISKMEVSDLEEISDILKTDFDDFWSCEIFRKELINQNSMYIIARIENTIVGFAGIWFSVDDVHITNVVTRISYRNKNIATNLLNELLSISEKKNFQSITLEVCESNMPAINLYKKLNFHEVGIRKNYYNGIENAIIMTKELLHI